MAAASSLQLFKGKQGRGGSREAAQHGGDRGKSSLTAPASHRGHLDLARFSELNEITVQLDRVKL